VQRKCKQVMHDQRLLVPAQRLLVLTQRLLVPAQRLTTCKQYSLDFKCVDLPPFSVPELTMTKVMCQPGYTLDATYKICIACAAGFHKSLEGNGKCTECPADSRSNPSTPVAPVCTKCTATSGQYAGTQASCGGHCHVSRPQPLSVQTDLQYADNHVCTKLPPHSRADSSGAGKRETLHRSPCVPSQLCSAHGHACSQSCTATCHAHRPPCTDLLSRLRVPCRLRHASQGLQ